MTTEEELKKIKKMYGEKFMHLCRELFPGILEQEGKLYEILTSAFAGNSRSLYEDITSAGLEGDFKNYIYNKIDVEEKEKRDDEKTPYELLEEAGYDLYECRSEDEIQEFKQYYADGEKLCTFNGGRLNRCEVFFAIRKDVEDIRREDFTEPRREDEYGTSVMSIQFNRQGRCTVSIKNRYNHTVNNPDATYGNDLDRIIPGLTESFERLLAERGLGFNGNNVERMNLPGYTVGPDGKYYKYNMEINGKYYCPGNIVIENGEIKQLPTHQMLIDNFIVDMKNETIEQYDRDEDWKYSFVDGLDGLEKIDVQKKEGSKTGERRIVLRKNGREEPIIIEIDKDNQIIGYINEELKEVGNSFLEFNKKISKLELPSLETVGEGFLRMNIELENFNFSNLTTVGDSFLWNNRNLKELNLPNLKKAGDYFLIQNQGLEKVELPNLIMTGDAFLADNNSLKELNLPSLATVGDRFLERNYNLKELNLPNLTTVGNDFLCNNIFLKELNSPNLTDVGDRFLMMNEKLKKIYLPELSRVGYCFLANNIELISIELPELTRVGDYFLSGNEELISIELPNLTTVGAFFMRNNTDLKEVNAPNLTTVDDNFLPRNVALKELNLPSLISVGNNFMVENSALTDINLPNLTIVGNYFLLNNSELTNVDLPNLVSTGYKFIGMNSKIDNISLPRLTSENGDFLVHNRDLKSIRFPELTTVGNSFLANNRELANAELPNLTTVGSYFLAGNTDLRELDLPRLNVFDVGEHFLYSNHELAKAILNREKEQNEFNESTITAHDIAKLDEKSEITEDEIGTGKRIVNRIREIYNRIFRGGENR